jgi:hypothetical protein
MPLVFATARNLLRLVARVYESFMNLLFEIHVVSFPMTGSLMSSFTHGSGFRGLMGCVFHSLWRSMLQGPWPRGYNPLCRMNDKKDMSMRIGSIHCPLKKVTSLLRQVHMKRLLILWLVMVCCAMAAARSALAQPAVRVGSTVHSGDSQESRLGAWDSTRQPALRHWWLHWLTLPAW